MNEEQQTLNWREDIKKSMKAFPEQEKLQIKSGDTVQIEFLNEGKPFDHPDFGKSVIFDIKNISEGKTQVWFVKNGFLLSSIAKLGQPLTGKRIKVVRVGEKMNTRYTVSVLPPPPNGVSSDIPLEEITLENKIY